MNRQVIGRMLARLFGVLALAMLVAGAWSAHFGDWATFWAITTSSAIASGCAAALHFTSRGGEPTLRAIDALVVVTVGWLGAAVLGALPFLLSGTIPAYYDAFFETASGFSTTGATILVDIEALPEGILLWRMMTHWLGGIGIVVLFVALFPQLGVGAKHLFKTEVPGPITEGLRPKIKQTALALAWIYVTLTAVEALALTLAGLSSFEAICHAMTTIATGGFSTRNASAAAFASPAVDWIFIVFMYLAGINFGLYYGILQGRGHRLWRDIEWRTFTAIIVVVGLVITALIANDDESLGQSFRHALFHTLAIGTGTGLVTDDFAEYPVLAKFLLVSLMFFGGCAGSTTGGMKISRVIIMFKSAMIDVARTARPHRVRRVKLGRVGVASDVVREVFGFAAVFVTTVLVGAMVLAAVGEDPTTALTASLACVANVGPGLGEVGPTSTYAHIAPTGKVVLGFLMMLGRLEFFTVLALLLPRTWRR